MYNPNSVVVKTYTASVIGAIAVLQTAGFLPSTGSIAVLVEGFGGGGGGGGSGGTNNPGAGGGGARYNRALILMNLANAADVTIGAGGAGGTAGTTTASGLTGSDGGTSSVTDTTASTVLAAFGGGSGGHGSSVAAGGLTQPGGDHPSLLQPDTNAVDANAITTATIAPKPVGITGAGGSGQSSAQGFRSQPNSVGIDSAVANPIPIGAPGGAFITGASGGGGGNGPRGAGGAGADGVNPQTVRFPAIPELRGQRIRAVVEGEAALQGSGLLNKTAALEEQVVRVGCDSRSTCPRKWLHELTDNHVRYDSREITVDHLPPWRCPGRPCRHDVGPGASVYRVSARHRDPLRRRLRSSRQRLCRAHPV